MVPISNADFRSVLRLLEALSLARGETIKEKEAARKAWLLVKKLKRKDVNGKNKRRPGTA